MSEHWQNTYEAIKGRNIRQDGDYTVDPTKPREQVKSELAERSSYKQRCDEILLSRAHSEVSLEFSGEFTDEEIMNLLELCKEPSFIVPSGLTRGERREWALSKVRNIQ